MENKRDKFYNQKIDNELRKKKLEEDYGAHFSQTGAIPPEIESLWLNSIEEYEKQFSTTKAIPVFEYIGKPAYRKLNELEPGEVSAELHRLQDYMIENNVYLDTLCGVDDRELYRFITEELFFYAMDNIRIPGMMTGFIYEEFYPNAEMDIKDAYEYFFSSIMGKRINSRGEGYDLLYIDTDNYQDVFGRKLEKKVVESRINAFLDSFDYFDIVVERINEISINKDETDASLRFEVEYRAGFNDCPEEIIFKGEGLFRLRPGKYGGWDVYHISMPGFKI